MKEGMPPNWLLFRGGASTSLDAKTSNGLESDIFSNNVSDSDHCEFAALATKPFTDVWSAWETCSIYFIAEVTLSEKTKSYKDHVGSVDAEAMQHILRVAYRVWSVHGLDGVRILSIEAPTLRDAL